MSLTPAVRKAAGVAGLSAIADKVEAGVRLDPADAMALYHSPDILAIGGLANHVRERRHGDVSWFNRNQHINATNVCEATCIFCSFSRLKTGDAAAYTMSFDEAVGRLKALSNQFITEVHIVNGLNPDLPFAYYTDLLAALKRERPDLHIKGFTAVEIHYYAGKYGMSVQGVLEALRTAGLDSLPGGGAEIFADRARKKLCHDKVGSDGWIDIHRTAHRMGFRTNCTMLFGSIETLEERVDHMDRLRSLQDETGGFQTFIPLKFHNENNRLRNVAETTDLDCLKTLAIGRLFLDNFAHVKAYWPMMGIQVAQLSQAFGVSDIDGTVREERIYHMAGATTPQGLTRPELISLIHRAGRLALERDTLYRIVAETPALTQVSGPAKAIRIATVGYLNALPLTAHLDRSKHQVSQGVPSEIAAQLERGEVDVALVPVAAILAKGDWRVVPGPCIGAEGPVESVLIVAETPPEQWTEVLLDGESRTSAMLSRILLSEGPLSERVPAGLKITPVGPGQGPATAKGTTATLVIGDSARELEARFTTRVDLAETWCTWTGLPFVFAVWAGRPGIDPRIGGELREAAAIGTREVPTRFEGADRIYLTDRLRYTLDDRALMGLRRFAALGVRAGLFENGDIQLLAPETTTLEAPGPNLTERLAASTPRTGPVHWAMCVSGHTVEQLRRASDEGATTALVEVDPAELIRILPRLRGELTLQAKASTVAASGEDLSALARAGLAVLDLDDGLLMDPDRQGLVTRAKAAGLEVSGAASFGRGEDEAARIAHLDALSGLSVRTLTLRVQGWRGQDTDGQGTAADWLTLMAWIRSRWDFDILVPWETEGHAVLQVALRAGAHGVVPLQWTEGWAAKAWALDRSIRDAGYTPVRLGMETPEAGARRVVRRHEPKPQRPDVR